MVENLKRETVEKLAKVFGVTPEYIAGWRDDPRAYRFTDALPETRAIPVIGTIACGQPALAEQNIEGYVQAEAYLKADFALYCKGDSMINARIFDGDLVYIRHQENVENGEIAAVVIDGEATLKRVYKYPTRIELRPENPLHQPISYEGREMENVHIIGKAVAFVSIIR